MNREAVRPLVVALLAVFALAVAAATLDSAVVSEAGSGFGSGGEDGGFGGGESAPVGADSDAEAADGGQEIAFGYCWPVVREPPALVALGLVFVGLFTAIYRSTRSVLAGGAVCIAVGYPVGFIWALLAFCGPISFPSLLGGESGSGVGTGNESGVPDGGGGGSFSDGAVETLSSPSILVSLLVAVAIAVLLVALLFSNEDDGTAGKQSANDTEKNPDDRVATLGRVAGTAADRIEADAGAENEVYHAWREMTDTLAVDSPETTTPEGFASAAIDSGMNPDDVAELTSLFETVRYGGVEPTDAHERRAVETLRRIESNYGDD